MIRCADWHQLPDVPGFYSIGRSGIDFYSNVSRLWGGLFARIFSCFQMILGSKIASALSKSARLNEKDSHFGLADTHIWPITIKEETQ